MKVPLHIFDALALVGGFLYPLAAPRMNMIKTSSCKTGMKSA